MRKLLFLICCVVIFLYFHSQVVYAGQTLYSKNLIIEDVQPAIMSGSLGGIHAQSGIIDISNIDQNSIKVIKVHQEGNTAFIYCNFKHRQGEKFFGYIPLIRLKDSTAWINRDNGMILEK